MPSSNPAPATNSTAGSALFRCCCVHPFRLLTNRVFLRLAILVCDGLIFWSLLSYQLQVPFADRPANERSGILAMLCFSILGAVLSVLWLLLLLCNRNGGPMRMQCGDGTQCNCLYWEFFTDVVCGVAVGACAVVLLQISPCRDVLTGTCALYNTGVAFGLISMVPYFGALLQELRKCCCPSRASEVVSTTTTTTTTGLQQPVPEDARKSTSSVWPPNAATATSNAATAAATTSTSGPNNSATHPSWFTKHNPPSPEKKQPATSTMAPVVEKKFSSGVAIDMPEEVTKASSAAPKSNPTAAQQQQQIAPRKSAWPPPESEH